MYNKGYPIELCRLRHLSSVSCAQVGQAKIVRQSGKDRVLLIGAGITLHECLLAADKLKTEGKLHWFYLYTYINCYFK